MLYVASILNVFNVQATGIIMSASAVVVLMTEAAPWEKGNRYLNPDIPKLLFVCVIKINWFAVLPVSLKE